MNVQSLQKHIEVYRNHKHLTGYTEKPTYVRRYPFSQFLSHILKTVIDDTIEI